MKSIKQILDYIRYKKLKYRLSEKIYQYMLIHKDKYHEDYFAAAQYMKDSHRLFFFPSKKMQDEKKK